MGRVDGKVAIVTGAGGGIGSRVAELLAEEGAAVVVADIDGVRAEDTTNRILKDGGTAMTVQADISRDEDNRRMVSAAVDYYGRLDIFHANATGIDLGGRDLERNDFFVHDVSQEVWDGTFATTMRGTWLGCKHSIIQMLEQGTGSIVCTSSAAGSSGFVSVTAYGCAKAGVNSLVRYIATQYGKKGIRANAVAPGVIRHYRNTVGEGEQGQLYVDGALTPYLGEPSDIAYCVLYLGSDESKFVTGQVIAVDGGMLIHQPEYNDFRRLATYGPHPIDLG